MRLVIDKFCAVTIVVGIELLGNLSTDDGDARDDA